MQSALKFSADLASTVRSTPGKYETTVKRVPLLINTYHYLLRGMTPCFYLTSYFIACIRARDWKRRDG